MKEGWEYNKIGKLCKTYSGGTPLKNVKEYYQNGNIPWLRSGEVCKKYISETEMFITQKGLENSSAKYYPIDTVVVAMYGATAAQVGILKIEATSNQAVCGILPNRKFLPEFLYYFFCYRKEFLASQAQGGAQPNISQVKIKNLEVPVPPLSEQQSIVDYLDSAFAKIDAMKANAEKAINEGKALFQASLKEMLEPKEGWEEKKLKETCSVITDGTHHSPVNTANGKYKYVTAKNIKPWGLDLRNITFVSEDVHKEIASRCCPQKGDVLYIKDGATTGIAIVNPLDEEFSLLSSVALIRPNKNIMLSEYLCYALNSPSIYEQTRSQMDGAAITRVTLVKIKGFTIPLPPLSEQQSIVATLDTLKSKVDKLQANYEKISQECDALKQAILRQVFE
jgi:type I restriction enzyme S subunit